MSKKDHPVFGPTIYTYTRAQALADGVLIDAGPMAREVGFRVPVALTGAAWQDCVAWTESENESQTCQDPDGRLWDVLYMATFGVRHHRVRGKPGNELLFKLHRVPRDGCSREPVLTKLKLVMGPGDAGEPVITIMLPHGD